MTTTKQVAIEGFSRWIFTATDGKARPVYQIGMGPPVLVTHEISGLGAPVLAFASRLASQSFTVYCPMLFGRPAASTSTDISGWQKFRNATMCLRREFAIWEAHRSSPIVDWLRELGRSICDRHRAQPGFKGLGAVGLCVTGNFAIAMMVDDHLLAPVASEPALPGLHLSDREIYCVRQRVARGDKILAFRLAFDCRSPATKFEAFRTTFAPGFLARTLRPQKFQAHSVLTADWEDTWRPSRLALARLVSFLKKRLS